MVKAGVSPPQPTSIISLVLIAFQLFLHHLKYISIILTFENLLSIRKVNVADIIPPALRNDNPGDTLQKSK